MTEGELLAEVTDLCEEYRLLWHHCPDSRRCHGRRGFPDLVVAGPGGHLFRELKGEYGETSAEQDLWGWTLDHTKGAWGLWTPSDLRKGTIRAELRLLA